MGGVSDCQSNQLCCLVTAGSSSFIHLLNTGGEPRTTSTCQGHHWPDKATKGCTSVDIAAKIDGDSQQNPWRWQRPAKVGQGRVRPRTGTRPEKINEGQDQGQGTPKVAEGW